MKIKSLPFILMLIISSPYAVAQSTGENANPLKPHRDVVGARTAALEKQVAVLEAKVNALEKQKATNKVQVKQSGSSHLAVVSIAPYLGFDNTAVVTLPSYNEDVRLLQQNQRLQNKEREIDADNKPVIDNPLLEVSGKIEGQANYQRQSSTGNNSGIQLTSAELDLAAHINQWLTGLMTFGYDKNAGYPVNSSSSRVYIDQAFVTLGNFNQSPFYGTLGQKYLPFGQYNNFMISAPLTQSIGRARAQALQVGYQHPGSEGLYGSLYAYKGYTKSTSSNENIDRGGVALGYEAKKTNKLFDIGLDAISNIADSQGMQGTGGGDFPGFGDVSNNEYIAKRVPGVDVHGKFYTKPWTFLVEYTDATKRFNANNLSFNGHGAQPSALDLQAAYEFYAWNKPSNFALGYDHSWQALALNIPQQSYAATFNTSIWKNTIASVELQHAVNYPNSNTASGQAYIITPRTNHYSNQVIARFGIYF